MVLQPKLTLLLISILCAGYFYSCNNIVGERNEIVVLIDVTDASRESLPTAEKVMSDINKLVKTTGNSINNGIALSVGTFDDVSGQALKSAAIEPLIGNSAIDNPKKREREMNEFLAEARQLVSNEISSTPINRSQSKIYLKLCNIFQNLSNETHAYVFVYSDLLENSELANFYDLNTVKKAASNPTEFYQEKFKHQCNLKTYGNQTIVFYTSRSPKTDVLVNNAEKFWQNIIKKNGAKVMINN